MKYLLLFFSLAIAGCSQQKMDCSKFKTGTFKYLDKDLDHIIITRNDSIQVEYNSKDDVTITTSIEWISQCRYVLTYQDITNYQYKNETIGKNIYVNILETEGDTYISQVSSNTTESKTSMVKIKR